MKNNGESFKDTPFYNGLFYNSIGPYLKKYFHQQITKLSIDGGFTCPNRDGTIGTGGCIFCSEKGSGDFTGDFRDNSPLALERLQKQPAIQHQMMTQAQIMKKKWPSGHYIAYFQNFTNTYAPVDLLRKKYEEALAFPGTVGIAIATRPDCLDSDVLSLLSELNRKTFLWVELGLQTIHHSTGELIQRGYSLSMYEKAIDDLHKRNIRTVTHLILGLPGEEKKQMLDSVAYVSGRGVFGMKLQLLHYIKGTLLGEIYENRHSFDYDSVGLGAYKDVFKKMNALSLGHYIEIVADALEIIPSEITIHRVTGDAPKSLLIAPEWSKNKRLVLNSINQELKKRASFQGKFAKETP